MPKIGGYKRQIFVLTDGSVSNESECLNATRNASNASEYLDKVRVYTLGIGSGVSTGLVNGLAIAGNGTAEYVIEGERMEKKCMALLKRSLMPAVENLSVDWSSCITKEKSSESLTKKSVGPLSFFNKAAKLISNSESKSIVTRLVLPIELPVIHPSKRLLLQILVKDTEELPQSVTIRGNTPDGPIEITVPVKPKIINGKTMHALALKRLYQESIFSNSTFQAVVKDVFKVDDAEAFVTQSLLNFSISSKKTSWILVFPNKEEGEMVSKSIAMPIPADRPQFYVPAAAMPIRSMAVGGVLHGPPPVTMSAPMQPMVASSMMSPQMTAPPMMAQPTMYSAPPGAAALQESGLMYDSEPVQDQAIEFAKKSKKSSFGFNIPKPSLMRKKEVSSVPIMANEEESIEYEEKDKYAESNPTYSLPESMPKGSVFSSGEITLIDFLKNQQFNGLYVVSDHFANIVSNSKFSSASQLVSELKTTISVEAALSIFALAFLKFKFSDLEDEWGMAARKTEKKLLEFCKDVGGLVDIAFGIIQ
eukprot:NODE_22_length_42145_cov_1.310612.p7 type:complete len:534 gc:universal NODE_22_length_42145_cov_1.310612:28302-26701(-)